MPEELFQDEPRWTVATRYKHQTRKEREAKPPPGSHASRAAVEYDREGNISTVNFKLRMVHGEVSFRLPGRVDGVLETLKRQRVEKRHQTRDQAERVAWRIVKDWITAQLAIVEAEIADMAEGTAKQEIQAAGPFAWIHPIRPARSSCAASVATATSPILSGRTPRTYASHEKDRQ